MHQFTPISTVRACHIFQASRGGSSSSGHLGRVLFYMRADRGKDICAALLWVCRVISATSAMQKMLDSISTLNQTLMIFRALGNVKVYTLFSLSKSNSTVATMSIDFSIRVA